MMEAVGADKAICNGWQARILLNIKHILTNRIWTRELLLRGSLARESANPASDIDLVALVAESDFDGALHDLTCTLPLDLPGRLPPWFDKLVRDFGGMGLVYLLKIDEQNWGELDIYVLPDGRRQRLIGHELTRSLWTRSGLAACDHSKAESIDRVRRRCNARAIHDLQQAVLACYVTMFLLRKHLLHGDRFQIFADAYAAALSVRDLIVLTCYPDRPEHGWYGLLKVVERSPAPRSVLEVLSSFARYDVLDLTALSDRVAGLEELISLLAPNTWREHGESLRSLGVYLRKSR